MAARAGIAITNLFTPPAFDEPAKTDSARVLHILIDALFVTAVPVVALQIAISPHYTARWLAIFVAFAVPAVGLLALNRAGRTVLASCLLTGALWTILTVAAWQAGGVAAPSIVAQVLVVSTAGALLGRRGVVGFGALAACTVIVLALIESAGLLPPASVVHTPISRAWVLVSYVAVIGVEWGIVTSELRRAQARTACELTERRSAEEQVRELNAELEDRVARRTAQLERAVTDLEATNAQLDEATRAKNAFLASMSHELRTPLNSIIGFSGVLEQGLAGPLTTEQARQIAMIGASGRRLLNLVNEVLDLTRIEHGRVMLDRVEFDACGTVRHAVETVRPMAERRGLDLVCACGADPLSLWSDESRVEQILLNLLGNAVKFTATGSVTATVRNDGTWVVFEVSDTGVGISPAEQDLVFARFYQAEPLGGGKHEGTGLGLPLSLELATVLGGDLGVTSEVGVGSTFELRLPLRARRPAARRRPTRGQVAAT